MAPELFVHHKSEHFQLFAPRQPMLLVDTEICMAGVNEAGEENMATHFLLLPNGNMQNHCFVGCGCDESNHMDVWRSLFFFWCRTLSSVARSQIAR